MKKLVLALVALGVLVVSPLILVGCSAKDDGWIRVMAVVFGETTFESSAFIDKEPLLGFEGTLTGVHHDLHISDNFITIGADVVFIEQIERLRVGDTVLSTPNPLAARFVITGIELHVVSVRYVSDNRIQVRHAGLTLTVISDTIVVAYFRDPSCNIWGPMV